jgi:hypothetical protein
MMVIILNNLLFWWHNNGSHMGQQCISAWMIINAICWQLLCIREHHPSILLLFHNLIIDDLEMKHLELKDSYNTYDCLKFKKIKFKNSNLYVCLVINIIFPKPSWTLRRLQLVGILFSFTFMTRAQVPC